MTLHSKLRFFAGSSLLILASCSNKEVPKELHSGVILDNIDTSVTPGDNFANYVNGTWNKNTVIPADKASYGVGYILHEQAQDHVKEIIEQAGKSKPAKGSDAQKIGSLYESYMNLEAREKVGVTPLKAEFDKIDGLKSNNDLAGYFGYATKYGISVPFGFGVETDFHDPHKYMLLAWQTGLGLPEREYYLQTDAKSLELKAQYQKHVEKMLQISGISNGKLLAAEIVALETKIASKQMKKEDTRNMAAIYNKYATSNLKQLMPNFNWDAMFKSADIPKQDTVVIGQVAYIKDLNAIIENTPLNTWKAYLKWGVVNKNAARLNKALDDQNFEFYSKTLYGIKEKQPLWRRAVNSTNANLGEIVGKLYAEKYFPPAAKERMLKLVNNLLKAYESSIKELDWMGEETKKQALDKITKFTPKIGYPDKWIDYSALTIEENDLYGNLKRATEFDHARTIAKLGKPVDRGEWVMTPQTVNAYYNPTLNEIVFPAAILQPPYFDMNAEDAVNYGGIGAVIGHEIGHGFDDQGSTFDGNGVMRNWWTAKDLEQFKSKTNALVAQYDAFKVFPDLNVNGTFTLGENIGDLGGLSIALKAYKASLNGKEAPVMDGFTGEQRVFIGWGQVWLEKANEESLRNQVNTDPHAPNNFRVNGVVRNIPEFYKAFNVKPTDSLYLAPEKRVKIW